MGPEWKLLAVTNTLAYNSAVLGNAIKLFTVEIVAILYYARAVTTSIHFHTSLLYAGKARSLPFRVESHIGLYTGRLQPCPQILD